VALLDCSGGVGCDAVVAVLGECLVLVAAGDGRLLGVGHEDVGEAVSLARSRPRAVCVSDGSARALNTQPTGYAKTSSPTRQWDRHTN
jgi:hypothetical protein